MNCRLAVALTVPLAILLSGCRTSVPLPDLNYPVETVKHNAGITVVIDPNTLKHRFQIGSQTLKWRFQPGQLLKAAAETELAPMFARYTFTSVRYEPGASSTDITLVLKLKDYNYSAHAKGMFSVISEAGYIVLGSAYDRNGTQLFNNVYVGRAAYEPPGDITGFTVSTRIQNSSVAALRPVFHKLRTDLDQTLSVVRR